MICFLLTGLPLFCAEQALGPEDQHQEEKDEADHLSVREA